MGMKFVRGILGQTRIDRIQNIHIRAKLKLYEI